MSYEQHMKHFRNHRKDRFIQQCSGYGGSGESRELAAAQWDQLALDSFNTVVAEAQNMEFPIYVAESGGYWHMAPATHLFAEKIESFDSLLVFGEDYVDGFSRGNFSESIDSLLSSAAERSSVTADNNKSTFDFGKE